MASQLSQDDEVIFSSQAPEPSQSFTVRQNDHNHFATFPADRREKAIADMSRLLLFRALTMQPLDRLECIKTAGLPTNISSAVMTEANERLKNCFGFELKPTPEKFLKSKLISKKYKDRSFLVNAFTDEDGTHSKSLHSVHDSIDKGLLMVVLALIYCNGQALADSTRWLRESEIYKYLNRLDENISEEPPKNKRARTDEMVTGNTPNVDVLLEKYAHEDYLVRVSKVEQLMTDPDDAEFYYAMGPRALLTIGQKQIIYFCAEVCETEVDPSMLQELEQE